jgi:predicted XRE-type DNA-binding protein
MRAEIHEAAQGLHAAGIFDTETMDTLDRLCHPSSGNVFADLGFEDAEELQRKALLTYRLYTGVKALGLTRRHIRERCGLPSAVVAKLMHCKHTDLSVEQLQHCLTALEEEACS